MKASLGKGTVSGVDGNLFRGCLKGKPGGGSKGLSTPLSTRSSVFQIYFFGGERAKWTHVPAQCAGVLFSSLPRASISTIRHENQSAGMILNREVGGWSPRVPSSSCPASQEIETLLKDLGGRDVEHLRRQVGRSGFRPGW